MAEFIYKDERISFPRILRLPRKASAAAKEAAICEALSRANNSEAVRGSNSQAKLSYVDAVISESVVDAKPFRRMEIKCRKKFKLLTYVEASR